VFSDTPGEAPIKKRVGIPKVHFVKFQWDHKIEKIVLNYYDREILEVFEWVPDSIDISVSGPRKCIGFYQYDRYHPCIIQSAVEDHPQCLNCISQSIPVVRCVFEPECRGHRCPGSICGMPHQVYIAFFNTRYKVGMTSQKRLAMRIIEQGADAYTYVATLPDRLSARTLERRISRSLGFRESYDPEETLRTLTERLRKKVIEEKYQLVARSLKNGFGLSCSELIFVDGYQLEMPLRSTPKLRNTEGMHRGRAAGIKGKFLIYENNGLFALRLDELLGNYIKFLDCGH